MGRQFFFFPLLERTFASQNSHLSSMTCCQNSWEALEYKIQITFWPWGKSWPFCKSGGWVGFTETLPTVRQARRRWGCGKWNCLSRAWLQVKQEVHFPLCVFLQGEHKVRKTICMQRTPGTRHHPLSEPPRRNQTTDDSNSQQAPERCQQGEQKLVPTSELSAELGGHLRPNTVFFAYCLYSVTHLLA